MSEDKKETKPPEKSQRQKEIEELRKNRVPAGIPGINMSFPPREGYTRRVVVDRPGRLDKFYGGGWRYVTESQLDEQNPGRLKAATREGVDSRVSQVVGSNKDGSPQHGFLMEIPTELYDEDQEAKQDKINRLEGGLRQGKDADGGSGPGVDGRYIPSTGIQIQRGRR